MISKAEIKKYLQLGWESVGHGSPTEEELEDMFKQFCSGMTLDKI